MSDNISNYLPEDGKGSAIQVARTFRTYDDAGSPVKSPISLATATNQPIAVPINAPIITIYTNQELRLGVVAADVEGTGDGYTLVPADMLIIKNVAGLDSFYLRNESGGIATIYFDFAIL